MLFPQLRGNLARRYPARLMNSRRRWRTVLGYGLLAAAVLGCLQLIRLAPPAWGWPRELVGAAIAIVALAVGLNLARRPPPAPPAPSPAPPTDLSPRELEVLRLLCAGQRNKDMARALHLSENTVKTHLANLYAKLQVGKRTEAQAAAYRLGLIDPNKDA